MSSLAIAAAAFVFILASAAAGMLLRRWLPEHHLSGDSKDVIKLATALIATMSALVLALLFASARTSFDRDGASVSRLTADLLALDRLLADYGPEAAPVRAMLRTQVEVIVESIWQRPGAAAPLRAADRRHDQSVLYMLRALQPAGPLQASIRAHALQVEADIMQTHRALLAQPSDAISSTFVSVLVLWLGFIFTVFAMSSPTNPTLAIVLGFCILSASAAIYLILELRQPFAGLMQVSSEGLRNALR